MEELRYIFFKTSDNRHTLVITIKESKTVSATYFVELPKYWKLHPMEPMDVPIDTSLYLKEGVVRFLGLVVYAEARSDGWYIESYSY